MTNGSYQVLARKYRPQTFEDVAGQGNVVTTLKRALEMGRVAHAFLFTGSRGVGKTTLARILARCLVCAAGPTPTPCGTCAMCLGVSAGSLTDVVEIDGASNNSVDQIRDLQEMARFLPQLARFKIFIVDEVHMLSTSAFNALLKILEEPPPHVKFVFATTEPHKIPVTILSRCQRYDFKRLPQKTIVARIKQVLLQEGVGVSDAGIEVIARAAEGGMRDALSLTDQVLSFAGENATADMVTEALGIIDRRSIVTAVEAAIVGDAKAALAVVDNAFQRGHDLKQLLSGIAEEIRHLCVANAAGSVVGLADLTDEDAAAIDARAKTLDGKDLLRLLAMALDGIDPLQRADDPRMHVELVLLRMVRRPPLTDALAISEALVRLEAFKTGKPVPPLPNGVGPMDIARAAFPLVGVASDSERSAKKADAAAPVVGRGSAEAAPAPAPPARVPPVHVAPAVTPAAAPQSAPVAVTPMAPLASASVRGGEDSVDDGYEAMAQALEFESPPLHDDDVAEPPRAAAKKSAPSPEPMPPELPEDDEEIDPAFGLPLVGIDARFIAFADALSKANRPLAMHVDQARVVAVANNMVDVAFDREMHERAVGAALTDASLRQTLAVAFAPGTQLRILKRGEIPSGATPSPTISEARQTALAQAQADLEARAKEHPLIKKALALFGGSVRSVKRHGAP